MNIFVLDESPRIAAEYHCDKHVVKMLLESAQILSDAHRFYDPRTTLAIYQSYNWRNHPCCKWARANGSNYKWLWELATELGNEFEMRYGKAHASTTLVKGPLRKLPKTLHLETPRTPFVQCVPEVYQRPNPVRAYRAYYVGDKLRFAKWQRGRPEPYWLKEAQP